MLGVSRSAAANWESGSARPSSENLGKIALATDCSIDWLATGRGMPSDALMTCCDVDMVFEPDEGALLRAYRNSHPGARRLLLQLATRHVETKP